MTPEIIDTELDDEAFVQLRTVIGQWLAAAQLEGELPIVSASKLFNVLAQVIGEAMGTGAVRAGMLMALEQSHDKPMSFLERQSVKETLDQISNARRKVEGKPHLILPGTEQ